MQIRKKGEEIKKKSSPLKLLSQSQPNFAEMILGWPPSKNMYGDPDFQPRWRPSSKERDPPRDHPCQVWFNLVQRFQRRRFKCDLLSKYA
jgi:hypothetical protein